MNYVSLSKNFNVKVFQHGTDEVLFEPDSASESINFIDCIPGCNTLYFELGERFKYYGFIKTNVRDATEKEILYYKSLKSKHHESGKI